MTDFESVIHDTAQDLAQLLAISDLDIERVAGGNMNYAFVIRLLGGEKLFVKKFASRLNRGTRLDVRDRFKVELEVLGLLAQAELPAPRVRAISVDNHIIVEDYVAGDDATDFLAAGGSLPSLLRSVAIWLGVFHAISPSLDASSTLASYARRQGVDDLLSLAQRPPHLWHRKSDLLLCRGDCHLGNFRVTHDGLVGTDFEMCAAGLPSAELASAFLHGAQMTPSSRPLFPTTESIDLLSDCLTSYSESGCTLTREEVSCAIAVKLARTARRNRAPRRGSWLAAANQWCAMAEASPVH